MTLDRRQLLKALGLGALSSMWRPPAAAAVAGGGSFPSRIVFFVQPHGHVPKAWKMPLPGAPGDRFAERSLPELAREELSEVLRPLYPFRDRLLAIEGLGHVAVLADIADVLREGAGGDANNHDCAVAGLLTGTRSLQRPGLPCSGGSRSLDQELGLRTAAPGRFSSRVYGSDYVPNLSVAPFSFLGPGQASPIVADPAAAFADLLGYLPGAGTGAKPRPDVLEERRLSVLDATAQEYERLAPTLGAQGRQKLESHRNLIRELETSLGSMRPPSCEATFDDTGHMVTQFMRLIRLAFACDLTRVVTFVAPVPQCPEFGYPASSIVHASYAHASVEESASCGQMFTLEAERAMTDLGVWYANHFALLLHELDSVTEGSGTMLDHTVVVWITELATPTHTHHDAPVLLAGGCNDFFKTGRYVRYPRLLQNPLKGWPKAGPAQNRLYVSLMQAMGQPDTSFGMTEATGADGAALSLRGSLTELQRS